VKKIYISGPMTGLPDLNFPAFHAEAARLRALGYEVVNPAELNPDPANKTYQACLRDDLRAMLDCDTVALLPGYKKSEGAIIEMNVAQNIELQILDASAITLPMGVAYLRECAKRQVSAAQACVCVIDTYIFNHGDEAPIKDADALRLAGAITRLKDTTAALLAAAYD
jgi:hypothetical protein